MATVFVQHISKDTMFLRTNVENKSWVPAQLVVHKLRGTVACFHLVDCTKSADALDAALKLQIARGDGCAGGEGHEAKALCATFLAEVDTVVAFFAQEQPKGAGD